MTWAESAFQVRVPATSANLGPGFDTLGLALSLHDDIEARVAPAGLGLSVTGEGAADVAGAGDKHLVVRAMRATFDDLGVSQPPGLVLRCVNQIPHGRGLGSSAAAIVAGILGARALLGAGTRPDAALPLAVELEGHPDNVAPCLYGGLTIAWMSGPRIGELGVTTGNPRGGDPGGGSGGPRGGGEAGAMGGGSQGGTAQRAMADAPVGPALSDLGLREAKRAPARGACTS